MEFEDIAAQTDFAGKSGARQLFQRTMIKLAFPVVKALGMPMNDENINRMADSRSFQEIVEECLLQNLAETKSRRNNDNQKV
jgi:hypothetical protein